MKNNKLLDILINDEKNIKLENKISIISLIINNLTIKKKYWDFIKYTTEHENLIKLKILLYDSLKLKKFNKGEEILKIGENIEKIYYIFKGNCLLFKKNKNFIKDNSKILKKEDFFIKQYILKKINNKNKFKIENLNFIFEYYNNNNKISDFIIFYKAIKRNNLDNFDLLFLYKKEIFLNYNESVKNLIIKNKIKILNKSFIYVN